MINNLFPNFIAQRRGGAEDAELLFVGLAFYHNCYIFCGRI